MGCGSMEQSGLASQLASLQPLCLHPSYELRDINVAIRTPIRTPIYLLFPMASCRVSDD